jgi:hypothetical protein
VVEFRNEEGNNLLIMRDTVLGAESITSPYMNLKVILGRIIIGNTLKSHTKNTLGMRKTFVHYKR